MNGKRILIIDDDRDLREVMKQAISGQGAQVFTAVDGQEGLSQFYTCQPDLVIVDLMMPKINGREVCALIRQTSNIPIIILSALDSETEVIRGLDCGAVDYITKPFSPAVLVARVRAALRQAAQSPAEETLGIYSDDYLTLDLDRRRVLVRGEPIKLSPTEYRLLVFLHQNAGRVVTIQSILENVWGWEYRDSVDYAHVYMSHLRRKLEKDPRQPQYLLTEHGVGYRFEKQVSD